MKVSQATINQSVNKIASIPKNNLKNSITTSTYWFAIPPSQCCNGIVQFIHVFGHSRVFQTGFLSFFLSTSCNM